MSVMYGDNLTDHGHVYSSSLDELMLDFGDPDGDLGDMADLFAAMGNFSLDGGNASASSLKSKSMFRYVIHQLDLYMVPVICVVGLTGNLLSFVVFVCTYMRRLSSSVYLAALAVTDTLFLICLLVSRGGRQTPGASLYTMNGWCQTFLYITYLSSFLSVWYVVSFTAERYIVVNYPLKRQHLCTTRRAKGIVIGLAVFAALLYSFGLWTSGVNNHYGHLACGPTPRYYNLVLIIHNIDTFITLILPFLAIVVMNMRIAYKVVLFYRDRKHMALDRLSPTSPAGSNSSHTHTLTPAPAGDAGSGAGAGATAITAFGRVHRIPCSSRTRIMYTRTQVKVTKMMLTISTIFLVLNLPRHTARAYSFVMSMNGHNDPPSSTYIAWQKIFDFLYYMHFSVNLFLYSVLGKNFRRAFVWLCRRFKHSIVEYVTRYSYCRRYKVPGADDYVVNNRREIVLNEFQRAKLQRTAGGGAGGDGGGCHRVTFRHYV